MKASDNSRILYWSTLGTDLSGTTVTDKDELEGRNLSSHGAVVCYGYGLRGQTMRCISKAGVKIAYCALLYLAKWILTF